jgi:hypothetical protein
VRLESVRLELTELRVLREQPAYKVRLESVQLELVLPEQQVLMV